VPTSFATLNYPLDVPTIKKWEVVDRKKNQAAYQRIEKYQKLDCNL